MNAIDCATKLNGSTAAALKQNGVTAVGRYLPTQSWKGLTVDEVNAIKSAGLQLWSIYEKGGTSVKHFSATQGQADAQDAYKLAQSLGQPEGSAIYFAVDYDAKPSDMDEIEAYFCTVKATLKSYKVGVYGKYEVISYLQSKGIADYYWQTYAWSGGQRAGFKHLFQYKNDTTLAGINVDYVNIEQPDFGAWGKAVQKGVQPFGTVTIDYPNGYGVNAYDGPNGQYKTKLPGGFTYSVYSEKDEFYDVGQSTWVRKENCILKRKVIQINYPNQYGVNAYDGPNGNFKQRVQGGLQFAVYNVIDGWYDIGQSTWVPVDCVKEI